MNLKKIFLFIPKKTMFTATLCLIAVSFIAGNAGSQEIIDVGIFSAGKSGELIPDGWKPLYFRNIGRHTIYSISDENGTPVVMAKSVSSASGLTREIRINPFEYPIIRWKWKVENILKKGDAGRKEGDDYPARIYVTFQYDPAKAGFFEKSKYEAARLIYGQYPPHSAINYIWESKTPAGSILPNSYTNRTMMFVIESGSANLNRWIEEERNVYEDYRRAFGEDPPMISGVAIMTDTDNTGETATAYFGDIRFEKKRLTP
jgi:hypothetical protein